MKINDLSSKKARAKTDPIFFAEEFLGMQLHSGQKIFLEIARQGFVDIADKNETLIRRFLLSCANRWGKSAVIAILQLWVLFNKFGLNAEDPDDWFSIEYRTANIAPSPRSLNPFSRP